MKKYKFLKSKQNHFLMPIEKVHRIKVAFYAYVVIIEEVKRTDWGSSYFKKYTLSTNKPKLIFKKLKLLKEKGLLPKNIELEII